MEIGQKKTEPNKVAEQKKVQISSSLERKATIK